MDYFDQQPFEVRCEWGSQAVRNLAVSDVVVIVDVLSFTTSVEIAVSRGVAVYPFPADRDSPDAYARERDAQLAGKRSRDSSVLSLAPSSLVNALAGLRLVLPSPNGSALSFQAADTGAAVVAGSLRNASAVATWAMANGKSTTIVCSSERWPDGSLRPAIEDAIGAGALIRELPGRRSPEAAAAVAVFEAAMPDLNGSLLNCASGRELVDRGFEHDVELASELNVSRTVPILKDAAFVAHRHLSKCNCLTASTKSTPDFQQQSGFGDEWPQILKPTDTKAGSIRSASPIPLSALVHLSVEALGLRGDVLGAGH